MQLKVPSIVCDVCGQTIKSEIEANVPDAKVSVDVAAKIVTVEATAPESTIRKIITAVGHEVE